MPLDNTQVELPPKIEAKALKARRRRYQLRATAARLLRFERTGSCGKALSSTVDLKVGGGKGYFSGVETCGSVWACPVCAAKVAERRRLEIAEVCDKHAGQGGAVFMATLTIPHTRFDDLASLRETVALAWRKMQAGAPWRRFKDRFNVIGTVRALETTWGNANGWHPHLHVLIFAGPHSAADMGDALYRQWESAAARAGAGGTSKAAFRFERAECIDAAGDYVSKWGVDFEVAHGQGKTSSGESPWSLLERASKGDKRAAMLFRTYAEAFKGARQLTWSRDIRDHYGVNQVTDQEAAEAEPEAPALKAVISRRVYREAAVRGVLPQILEAAEAGDLVAIIQVLRRYRIDPGRVDFECLHIDVQDETPTGDDEKAKIAEARRLGLANYLGEAA